MYIVRSLTILAALCLSACKITVVVPEGGHVVSSSGQADCMAASTCEVQVEEGAPFAESFTAVPNAGYRFSGWKKADQYLCGESIDTCALDVSGELTQFGVDLFLSPIFVLDDSPTNGAGVISGFGSVIVNGVYFNSDDAAIQSDDADSIDETDLMVGMFVDIQGMGEGAAATANTIRYRPFVVGTVEAIDLAGSLVTVMGISFQVDDLTEFSGAEFSELELGDLVKVSALEDDNGNYIATLIDEVRGDAGPVSRVLTGEAVDVDTDTGQFTLGDTQFSFAEAEVNGDIQDGVRVRVVFPAQVDETPVIASRVDVLGSTSEGIERLSLTGVVSGFVSTEQFNIADQAISSSADTVYAGGQSEQLADGTKVTVRGELQDDGTLAATHIRFDKPSIVRLEGTVESVDVDNALLIVVGTELTVDAHTQFIDQSELRVHDFGLDDILVGDQIEIKAFEDQSALLVRQIKRKQSGDTDSGEVELEGPVTAIGDSGFSIRNMTISTSELTEVLSVNAEIVSLDDFYDAIASGDKVLVRGIALAEGGVLALAIEMLAAGSGNDDEQANRVKFKGTIDSIESISAFTVNGHSVTTDENTRFQGGDSDSLVEGTELLVHGFQGDNGTILAKRIILTGSDDENEAEIEGEITTVTSPTEFIVADQPVLTDDNTVFKNGDVSDILVGALVEVKGEVDSNGVLVADELEFEEPETVSVEGIISAFVSADDFMVGEWRIVTDESTEYEGGDASMLDDGLGVEVEGLDLGDGRLLATEIELDEPGMIEIEGVISSFTSTTEFVIDGQIVFTDEFTHFVRDSESLLAEGLTVTVKGYLNESGALLARFVKADFSDNEDEDEDEDEDEE